MNGFSRIGVFSFLALPTTTRGVRVRGGVRNLYPILNNRVVNQTKILTFSNCLCVNGIKVENPRYFNMSIGTSAQVDPLFQVRSCSSAHF
jgi:hypothetical protein